MNPTISTDRFNLSTFHSPRITLLTLFAYLNMVLFQLTSAMAMDGTDCIENEGNLKIERVIPLRQFTPDDFNRLQQLFTHNNQLEGVKSVELPTLEQTSPPHSKSWFSEGKLATVSSANYLKSLINVSPSEAQFLSYCAIASTNAMLMSPDVAEYIMLLWAGYLATKATLSVFNRMGQFATQTWQDWRGYLPAIPKSPLLKQINIRDTSTLIKALIAAGFTVVPASALTVENANLNLTGIKGSLIFFKPPIKVLGAYQNKCQAFFQLLVPQAGSLVSNGTSPLKPTVGVGSWIVSGDCSGGVNPLLDGLAVNVSKDFSGNSLDIYDAFSDESGSRVTDFIKIYFGPPSPPTTSPSPAPTGTGSPTPPGTPAPTVSPSPAPTGTGSPTPSGTPIPTVSPSPAPTGTGSPTQSPIPTVSPSPAPTDTPPPTGRPTQFPSPPPSWSPTDSPTDTPTWMPTSSPTPVNTFNYTPIIITAVLIGSLCLICSVLLFIGCMKNKKKEKRETYNELGSESSSSEQDEQSKLV